MIKIRNLTKISEEKYHIGMVDYDANINSDGIEIKNIPIALGEKNFTMYWNPQKREIFYEYEDIPKPKEDIEKETFTKALAQLTIENKKKDAMIAGLAQQVNTLNIKMNKLGGDK